MNKKLHKSPLTYVLAQVKISQVLEIETYIPRLQEAIRKDFPLFKKIDIQTIEIKQNMEKPEFRTFAQWHFVDKTSTTGILVDNSYIMIHTSAYTSFTDLTGTLQDILNKFNKELGISLYTRVGLRYINFIHSPVTEFVKSGLQGFLINQDGFKNEYITKVDTTQKTTNGTIKIQSTHVSDMTFLGGNSSANNIFVPLDLRQSAGYLSFDKHQLKKSSKEHLMLDIDHFSEKESDFDTNRILKDFEKLHDGIEMAFNSAVTKTALTEWK